MGNLPVGLCKPTEQRSLGFNEGACQGYLHAVTDNFTDHPYSDKATDHSVSDHTSTDNVTNIPFTDIITDNGSIMYTTQRVVCRSYG